MKLSFLMWLASVLPQPAADQLCMATTVYLEARDQPVLGQRAVAEVAMRRKDSGLWGDSVCEVVNAPKQFAPTLVNPGTKITSLAAWEQAIDVTLQTQRNWDQPVAQREEVVPGASHFAALRIASPSWQTYPRVAKIGDHTFFRANYVVNRTNKRS
jgi:spore germination cell wall hydrolase CwlJ-like protein